MGLLLIVLVFGFVIAMVPQMWVKRVLERHSVERADFPGTGAEFARHVLDEMKLTHVAVEETDAGDHYDPGAKVVRLSPEHFGKRSLSAVVVAAHEVGHAMQDATHYQPLVKRTQLAKTAHTVERFGSMVMLATPFMILIVKSPQIVVVELFVGMLILGSTIVMHAVTLPVELDASFRRALPLLKAGNYINGRDMGAARQILRAAAFTYVAAAAKSLLDVARWFRVLRF
ncbi:MAG: zinc metallopeptidase [Hyphomicrobiaceae bacterium]